MSNRKAPPAPLPRTTAKPALGPVGLMGSIVLAVAILYGAFGQSRTNFETVTLAPETQSVQGSLDGELVHCETLADAEDCLGPARRRNLDRLVLWLGNSQLHSINQFKDGNVPASALFARYWRERKVEALTFSQPNAALVEHFVLSAALAVRRKPDVLIVPLVFDDTRETHLRDGIAMAAQEEPVKRILASSRVGQQVAATIEAQSRREDKKERATLQDRSEDAITGLIERCCGWETLRSEARGQIGLFLYVTRNSLLGIKPTSVRKKIPAAYDLNLAALAQILKGAATSGTKVITYIAPLRSDASRPYDPIEYAAFKRDTRELAARFDARFLDLEDLVPNRYWGSKDSTSVDGTPEIDFMHFQAAGHALLAERLEAEVESVLK